MPQLDFFFDPGCPWTWITSRWVTEVAPHRDIRVRWRSLSLTLLNEGQEFPPDMPTHVREKIRSLQGVTLAALRVLEAVRDEHGDEPLGALYTQYGVRIHHDETGTSPSFLTDALAAAGLDPGLAEAGKDPRWDGPIRASMQEATGYVGEGTGSPVLVFDTEPRRGIWGPVLSPAPTGEAAVRFWDHLRALADEPGFFELKRARTAPPTLPDR